MAAQKSKGPRIDPWGAQAVQDYSKLYKEFGLQSFPDAWKKKLDHYIFRRSIVIAHRDFEKVLDRMRAKRPFINITGFATSGPLHLGHKLVVDIFKFFSERGGKNLFTIGDLDAYCSRPDSRVPSLKAAREWAAENIANLLALGLKPHDMYLQSRKEPAYYSFTLELGKKLTPSTVKAVYGELDLGKHSANLLQFADILHGQLPQYFGTMPSITPIAIEQDPHMRLSRDLARKLGMELPSSIYIKHQPALLGPEKMSSSLPDSAIFLTDAPEVARRKLMTAFTGGRDTAAEHRKLGGNPEICRVCALLRFQHPDDKKVSKIIEDFRSGKLLSGELKQIAAEWLTKFLVDHQQKYKKFEPVAREMVFGE